MSSHAASQGMVQGLVRFPVERDGRGPAVSWPGGSGERVTVPVRPPACCPSPCVRGVPGRDFGVVVTQDGRVGGPAGAGTVVDVAAGARSPGALSPVAVEELREVCHRLSGEVGDRRPAGIWTVGTEHAVGGGWSPCRFCRSRSSAASVPPAGALTAGFLP